MILEFVSSNSYYITVLEYIYKLSSNQINNFFYLEEIYLKNYNYNRKNLLKEDNEKILIPGEIDIEIDYKNTKIKCRHYVVKDNNGNAQKILKINDCCGGPKGEVILCKLEIENDDKNLLIDFVDKSRESVKDRLKKHKSKSTDTVRVYYYNDYWYLFSKIPKRPIDTLYLEENMLDNLKNNIENFFSDNEREDYLSFGMPYKYVTLLYGLPGSGKTSTINTIASYFDCDIHILPLSTDMDDTHLVDAFSSVNSECERNAERHRKLIVIEDIDCMFNDRKKGDSNKNGITLQGLLNCMDGFTCIEGALIFITANNPETLDKAVIRSSRVDYKIQLNYANEFQTKNMFKRFLPNQMKNFDKFYNSIKSKKYTTAMLQELLFFNRKCDDIMLKLNEFNDIIDKNNPEKLSSDSNKYNHYI